MLVAGATGCIGRHVCAAFAADGFRVVGATRGIRAGTGPVDAEVVHRLDLVTCGAAALADLLDTEHVDVVVNATLAWASDQAAMDRANVTPVDTLLAAIASSTSAPRLVQLGSIHEYGEVAPGTAIDERTPPRPTNSYARSKLTASERVLGAIRQHGLDAVVVRIANTVGPHPVPRTFFGGLAASLAQLEAASPALQIPIADARRDYVDSRDAADAVLRVAHSRAADPVVNVGSGRAYEVRAMVRDLVAAAGLPPDVVEGRDGTATGMIAGPAWTLVDVSRARELLGWEPRRSMPRSLADLYRSVALATT